MTKITFELSEEYIELSKLLKVVGLCESGGIAKQEILQSQVKVDGEIELRKGRKIRCGQSVEYADHVIRVA